MFIKEMYEIERLINSYKKAGIIDVKELIKSGFHHQFSSQGLIYYKEAVLMPYKEMINDIRYYRNTDMEETTEMLWWEELCDKYAIDTYKPTLNEVIQRFKDVERLSKSIIYKNKMTTQYNNEKRLLKK